MGSAVPLAFGASAEKFGSESAAEIVSRKGMGTGLAPGLEVGDVVGRRTKACVG